MSNMQISVKCCGFMYTEKRNRKDREYERLCMVCGNYPQSVLRTDEVADGNYEGTKSMHAADFLLIDDY